MQHRSTTYVMVLLLVAALAAPAAGAQQQAHPTPAALSTVPPVLPFRPGELATYQVKLGGVNVGRGSLEVLGTETVDGHATLHAVMTINGGVPLARVNDRNETWIDPTGLFSRRFRQDVNEVRYHRKRTYDFFPERRTYRRENGESGPMTTDRPLDDVSFLYFARTLPLAVGDTYRLNRYFKESGNPVVLRVVRRETVKVPAGTFRTIVVQPTIQTNGLFGQGGQAEVYFTDDDRRIPVMVKSRVPVVGSLAMYLQSYRAGR
jgi:hypothetical protein